MHGANRDGAPLGYTAGKYLPDDTVITMLADVFRLKFLPQISALSAAMGSPGSLAGARFPISCSYVEKPLPPSTDLLSGCRVVGAKDTYAEGAGVKLTEVTIKLLTISRNGITLFDRARGIGV